MQFSISKLPPFRVSGSAIDRRDLWLCAVLLLIAAVVFGKDMTVGGPREDSAARVMDGVLIHDWVAAGPSAWVNPVGFAEHQYSYYPSLGIGSAYPPGFATVEALFFAVFGISVVTARLCVLTFALLTCSGLFVLMRRFTGRLQAFCVVLCLMAMPSVVYWTRQVALEMPTLAVLIWSAVAACHYHRHPSRPRLLLWIAVSLAAVMFKQTAVFVLASYGLLLLIWTIRKHAPLGHLVAAALCSAVLIGAYFRLISSGGASLHVLDLVLKGHSAWAMLSPSSWLTYALWAPSQTGVGILAFSAIGIALALRRPDALGGLTFLWFVSFYAMASMIQHKEPRYLFFGLAAFAVWAGIGIAWLLSIIPLAPVRAAGAAALALAVTITALRQPIDYHPDYAPLVLAHRDQIAGRLVLFDGLRDADFILAVRQHLGPRKCVVVRASKLLYACAANPEYRFQSYVRSADEVTALLKDFAFDGIIVERRPLMNIREERLLRESLRTSPDYALAESHILTSGPGIPASDMTRLDVDVYLPLRPLQRQVSNYEIALPMDDRVISVDLNRLIADIRSPM
jgi:hypothetical protein